MFLSQRPNNDPQPYKPIGMFVRHAERRPGDVYDPRPEFTQTRDTESWLAEDENGEIGRAATEEDAWDQYGSEHGEMGEWFSFSPRHEEFDTPVNPILAEFRHNLRTNPSLGLGLAEGYLRWSEAGSGESTWTAEERDHARRVLSKLLAVYGG